MNSNEQTDMQSFGRIDRIVNTLAEGRMPMQLKDIAAAVSLPRPTVCRILKDMVRLGYAAKGLDHRYTLGPKWLLLAQAIMEGNKQ